MVQNPSLSRQQQQQQRITRFALISAVASFMIGVMLPWNLRTTRQVQVPSVPQSLPEIVTPSRESTQKPEENSSPEAPVSPVPEQSSDPLSQSQNQQERQASSLPSTPINPRELPSVGQAMTQRVEGVQTAISRLKAQRFDKTIKYVDLNTDEKVIALTFDDGPWPKTTEQILDILKENNIKATFFWVGQALKNHKEIGKKVAADGHVVANHTWNHRYHKHSHSAAAKEIEDTADLIEELIGVNTTIFRPPGGVEDNGLVDYAFSRDYVNIMWSSDSRDWKSSASSIKSSVLGSIKPGRIVLLHDGGGNRSETVKALPDIISQLKEKGYRFVTIPELLEIADQNIAKQETQVQQQSSLDLNSEGEARE